MRAMFAVVLLVGLGLAGFAVHMAQNYVEKYQAALANERQTRKPEIETVDLYVVKAKVEYGEKLVPENVVKIKWPKNSVPEGTFQSETALFPDQESRPRYVLRPMEPGEPVMAIKVTAPGADAGLTSRIAKGSRAFAIRVDVASGVSGFLRPGDRVDVYWTGSVEIGDSREDRDFTKLIQAGVDLIAIDQTANAEGVQGTIARTVTVAVKPQQVAALAQAQNTGRLSLSLVGAQDDTVAEAIEVDQRSLLGLTREQKVVEAVQEERVCTIRTRRGAEVVQIAIPCSN
ncbi:Flp pilus assembly protein CpaB [Cognatishimia sp. WU-CL00825]|uniref:Flp pilus assembly protein CpaB n=1 Tax=Cognatishimia sp. WU-CL00825 TaxID=3127658 RepID=UPI003109EED1